MTYDHLPYRPCVGIMLRNAQGEIWVGERIDTPGAWQMPQGGIDKGESIESAALRELEEEISVTAVNVSIISNTSDWIKYDLPDHLIKDKKVWGGKYRGQKQRWFLLQLKCDDSAISIETKHPEFARWQWIEPDKILDLIVPFKRQVYETVLNIFKPYLI